SQSLAGCSGIGPGSPNASLSSDRDTINSGETVNFDARSSTTPEPTILDDYKWNFGDGETKTTKQGVISHVFNQAGIFEVTVEVFNDNGDSDMASINIFVNAIPEIILDIPDYVKTGQEARLDASDSFDPEGGGLEVVWDFDANTDSDGDSDPLNDEDGSGPITMLTIPEAGNVTGAVTISDDSGGTNTTLWTLRVISRSFRVVWEESHVDYDWSGYLEQGDSHEIQFQPGQGARLIQVSATLSLSRDILPIMWPEDNFTLEVDNPSSGWSYSVATTQDNITENASAKIERSDMNPHPQSDYTVFADSKEELMQSLLDDPDGRFGQGDWFWIVTALNCDPDTPVDGVDPDQGNDWALEAHFVVLVLRISEVSV
ncbi:MAG: PKD domain-containing protein, partial [Candidatus Thalassarchaeaceae archaeon]|nr:PKD domain-containing protein [Candidatus Thalassarchaeaceae archaeon]